MVTSYRILNTSGEFIIECNGEIHTVETLVEEIWQVNRELRAGLPKAEQGISLRRRVCEYESRSYLTSVFETSAP